MRRGFNYEKLLKPEGVFVLITEMSEKSAHIITDRQKKGALSSVKKPKLPKTVLINNEINFWPCLDENQNENFVKLLET